jgi:transposase-like protein
LAFGDADNFTGCRPILKGPDIYLQFLAFIRWPDGIVKCPTCGSDKVHFLANQQRWKCGQKHPCRQFNVKVGTIFEDSPLGLDKWLPAVWQVVNCKNGISSTEIAWALGVTQKTAWNPRPASNASWLIR